ncbi:MAG: sulfatase [Chloroflexi bacterium]|nr:sulfatase [Chloroflexota bacterium]
MKLKPIFLRFFTFVVMTVLMAAVPPAFAAQATPGRPNVIIIFADDLGWGDLGCYGHPAFKTPNLDRLAREGARLTDFYSTCPYCAPSRAALLTGRYQFRSGVTGNPAPDAGINDIGIPASEITLGEAFQSAGYRTCAIGKWHLGHKPEFYPTRHGFDEYLGILYSNDMRPVQLLDGEQVVEYPVVQATLTKRYTERALSFLERAKGRPFFMYVPGVMPHKPLAASEAFYKKSGAGLYGDAVAELDWSVGQILAKVKELELDDQTLVFFSSDNGPWYGGSTGGLRGMKGNTWEGGIRVPLLARWPGKIPAGHVSHEPAALIDLFVTSLTAAGIAVPKDRLMDGQDIFALLTSKAESPHQTLFSLQGPRLHTVRSSQWKLHVLPPGKPRIMQRGERWTDPRAPDGVTILAPYEQAHPSQYPGVLTGDETKALSLFDLEADPAEQHDVAKQHPETVKRLKDLYDEMQTQMPAPSARKRKP